MWKQNREDDSFTTNSIEEYQFLVVLVRKTLLPAFCIHYTMCLCGPRAICFSGDEKSFLPKPYVQLHMKISKTKVVKVT